MSKKQKLNTHFVDYKKILEKSPKDLDRTELMKLIGKHYQVATDWREKSPEIVSVLFKIKEVAGLDSIEDAISKIEDK